jgi:dTDP-4-amino-4,6-dideoxygalactose transaminase
MGAAGAAAFPDPVGVRYNCCQPDIRELLSNGATMTRTGNRMSTNKLAIDGGTPVRERPFPDWPVFDEAEVEAVTEVVRSGTWGELTGTKVREFERAFAAYQEAKHGVCVVNGTAALQIGLRALGVRAGDEVIMPSYTFIATPNAALSLGATPVFVDIDPDTFLLDPARIVEVITPRTRAIVPVHLFGSACDMDAILDIARRHGLAVLEDACQAWGAEWNGRRVGALGDLGAFSFQSSKNINAGEGGIIVTNDDALEELAWSLHNVGRRRGGEWYEHVRVGGNYRMTEFQAAILLVQLTRLPAQTAVRAANACYLCERLADTPGVRPPKVDPRVTGHAWHVFMMRYDGAAFGGMTRDAFLDALRAEGIPRCDWRAALKRRWLRAVSSGVAQVKGWRMLSRP